MADRPLSRLRGLLGRPELPDDEGLLITPASSIHTWFMRFAIDVAFLDASLTVLGTRENVEPGRIAGWRGARSVLELPAGACHRHKLRPGDRLLLDDSPEEEADVLLVLRRGEDSQIVYGTGSLSAATRTISAMRDLNMGVSAVLLHDDERRKAS